VNTSDDVNDPHSNWNERKTILLDELVRLEGRGDHINQVTCMSCSASSATFRCNSCQAHGVLYCQNCIVRIHEQHHYHVVEVYISIPCSNCFKRLTSDRNGFLTAYTSGGVHFSLLDIAFFWDMPLDLNAQTLIHSVNPAKAPS
jgi:hypothetical protein